MQMYVEETKAIIEKQKERIDVLQRDNEKLRLELEEIERLLKVRPSLQERPHSEAKDLSEWMWVE